MPRQSYSSTPALVNIIVGIYNSKIAGMVSKEERACGDALCEEAPALICFEASYKEPVVCEELSLCDEPTCEDAAL
jgi:hypothetical protein